MGEKNCALLPALGKQNATYSPCFTQPGKSLLLQPCKLGLCIASVSLPFTPHFLKPLPLLMEGKEEWCPLITRSGLWDASRRIYRLVQKKLSWFEFPAFIAAWWSDQPLHSQSAKTKNFQLNSLNPASFLLLNPVEGGRGNWVGRKELATRAKNGDHFLD